MVGTLKKMEFMVRFCHNFPTYHPFLNHTQEVTSHNWYPALVLLCFVQSRHDRSSRQAEEFLGGQVFACGSELPSNVECTPSALGNSPSIAGR